MIFERLNSLNGCGTSMITMTITKSPKAFDNAVSLLNSEHNIASNIKSRV